MATMSDTYIRQALRSLGLSEKEISVYNACLARGEIGIVELARLAILSRSTAYFVADELVKKGLLRFIQKGAHRIYSAEDPRKLTLLVERQSERLDRNKALLQSVLPTLNMRYSGAANKPVVSYYVGQQEMRQIFEDALLSGIKELLFVGDINVLVDSVGPEFLKSWNRRKVKVGIKTRGIWEKDQGQEPEFIQAGRQNLREVQYAPTGFESPTYVLLYSNKVAFLSSSVESYGVLIESKDLSRSMRSWFDVLWTVAK